jgi:hypothetical protein
VAVRPLLKKSYRIEFHKRSIDSFKAEVFGKSQGVKERRTRRKPRVAAEDKMEKCEPYAQEDYLEGHDVQCMNGRSGPRQFRETANERHAALRAVREAENEQPPPGERPRSAGNEMTNWILKSSEFSELHLIAMEY